MADTLGTVKAAVDMHTKRLDGIDSRLDRLTSTVDAVKADVAGLRADMPGIAAAAMREVMGNS